MKYASLTLALVLGVAMSGTAYAQMPIDIGATVQTGSTSLDVSVDADTGVSTDAMVDVDTGTAGSEVMVATDASAPVADFEISRKTLDAGGSYAVTEASDVRTSAALESYVAASILNDERLESVSISDGVLEVTYTADAKFLGFIPGSMDITATVQADGAAQVRYPWYAFLMMPFESRAELEARLSKEQASIRDEIAAEAVVSGGGEASAGARQWALVLERLRSSLYANASAEARL